MALGTDASSAPQPGTPGAASQASSRARGACWQQQKHRPAHGCTAEGGRGQWLTPACLPFCLPRAAPTPQQGPRQATKERGLTAGRMAGAGQDGGVISMHVGQQQLAVCAGHIGLQMLSRCCAGHVGRSVERRGGRGFLAVGVVSHMSMPAAAQSSRASILSSNWSCAQTGCCRVGARAAACAVGVGAAPAVDRPQ